MNNSKTDVEGHSKFLNRLFGSGVATAFNANALKVAQRAAGANASVDIALGDAHLELPSTNYSFWAWTDAVTNVAFTSANVSNPRYDTIVGWVDTTVTTTANVNSPGSFKFTVIAGSAGGAPTATPDATIQSTLGASVAWTRLADVLRPAGVDNVTNGNITDRRVAIAPRSLSVLLSSLNGGGSPGALVTDASGNVTTKSMFWEELGRTTVASATTSISVNVSANRKRHYYIIANGVSAAASDSYFLLRINGLNSGYRKIGYGVQNGGSGMTVFDASETDSLNTMTVTGNGGLFNVEQTLLDTGSGYVRGMCQSGHLGYMSNSLSTWKRSGTTPISTFDFVSTVSSGLGVGSELIVLGHD